MRKCPFCSEEIQDNAIKCKHCGSDLIEKNEPEKPVEVIVKKKTSGCAWLGLILIILAVIFFHQISKVTNDQMAAISNAEQQKKIDDQKAKEDPQWKKQKLAKYMLSIQIGQSNNVKMLLKGNTGSA